MQRVIWLVLFVGIVVVVLIGAIVYELSSHKTPSTPLVSPTPTPTIVMQPTQIITPTVPITTNSSCTSSDLSGTMSFQGAAGNIYGTFTLKNKSLKPCTLAPDAYVTITYTKTQAPNLVVTHTGTPGTQPLVLAPNGTVSATVHYPNGPECSGPVHQVPVTYSYVVPGNENVSFTPEVGLPASTIPVCTSTNEQTKVDITNFTTATTP